MGGDHGPGVVVARSAGALERSDKAIDELILVGNRLGVDHREASLVDHAGIPRVRMLHATEVVTWRTDPWRSCVAKRTPRWRGPSNWSRRARRMPCCPAATPGACSPPRRSSCAVCRASTGRESPPSFPPRKRIRPVRCGGQRGSETDAPRPYAIMGSVYSSEVLGYPAARRTALQWHRGIQGQPSPRRPIQSAGLDLNFHRQCRRSRPVCRRVDVVVCDGFVGNITLKTAESLANGMFRC
jgi:glycerol-3-phosphate acyltransferase PlsX